MIEDLRREIDRLARMWELQLELEDMGMVPEAAQVKAMTEKQKERIREMLPKKPGEV